MLKTKLLHPDILKALASNGHGAQVLIADSNFPMMTNTPGSCQKVFLNLSPGLLSVVDILKVIRESIPIERAVIMVPEDEKRQAVHEDFLEILGSETPVQGKKRYDFYQEAGSQNTCLAIATGEMRRFANILIVIGSVKPADNFEE
jgi:L-fucose mutarotase